jgi:hypothetical protein
MRPIEDVRQGMRVVDSTGKNVGNVVYVKLGDPGAITPAGQEYLETPAFLQLLRAAFGEFNDVPPERAEKLLRVGYVQVDPPGPGRYTYYAEDEIASVDGDTVRLSIPG